jgi:hypothetical protein
MSKTDIDALDIWGFMKTRKATNGTTEQMVKSLREYGTKRSANATTSTMDSMRMSSDPTTAHNYVRDSGDMKKILNKVKKKKMIGEVDVE